MAAVGITTVETVMNPVLGDLMLDDSGGLVFLNDLREEVKQRLWVRLQFFKGEWFLNPEEGVPYFENVLVKGPRDSVIRAIFENVIVGTEGVASLEDFSYELDKRTRIATIRFSCTLTDGQTFFSGDFQDFVIPIEVLV